MRGRADEAGEDFNIPFCLIPRVGLGAGEALAFEALKQVRDRFAGRGELWRAVGR